MRLIAVIKDPKAIAAILGHPAHRDDDPDSGPDPPQLAHPVGFIAAEDLPETIDTSGGTGKAPAIIALNDGKLWLGLPALGNTWMTWEEAYGAKSLPAEPIQAVVSSPAGHLMLLCRGEATDAPLAAYRAKGTSWEFAAELPAVAMSPSVKGTSVVLHPGGRQLYFAGGEGPGWEALLHRWDLLSGQFEPSRRILGRRVP